LLVSFIDIGVNSAYSLASAPIGSTQRAEINDIGCMQEQLAYHWHTTLKLYEQSKEVKVPADIGILPNCMYWLHAHDVSGKIRIE